MGSQVQSNSDKSNTFSVDASDELHLVAEQYEKLQKRSITPKALYRRWSADSGSHSIYHSGFIDELKVLIIFLRQININQDTNEVVTKLATFKRKFESYHKKRKSSADQVVGILVELLKQIQPNNALEENSDQIVRSNSWSLSLRPRSCSESEIANNISRSWSLSSLSFCAPRAGEDKCSPFGPPPPLPRR